LKWH